MMKVAIVGAGIAGLAMYHALRKHLGEDVEIHIYESYKAPSDEDGAIKGAGLGLAPNGIRTLYSISPDSVKFLQSHGYTHSHITFRNQNGALLGHFPVGSEERYGFAQRFIAREDVHKALRIGVPDAAIRWQTKVVAIEERKENVRIVFENGSDTFADLVVGADGVKSVVAGTIMDDSQRAQYSGTVGIGGFIPIADLPTRLQEGLEEDAVNMTFGLNGFFGFTRCDMTKTNVMWWSSFDAPNALSRDIPTAEIREQLLNRHSSWKTPYDDDQKTAFAALIEAACKADGKHPVLILPRFHHAKIPPHWGSTSGRIVLVGDAAHTLPSESGQGVSCAIEDAVTFARLLSFYTSRNEDPSVAYSNALEAYEQIRMPRLDQILVFALRRQPSKRDMGWIAGWFRDLMMWILCWVGERLNDKGFSYDVNAMVDEYLDKIRGEEAKTSS